MKRGTNVADEKRLLDRVRDAVLAVAPRAHVILYGSRARGNARPDSDWDVLVLVDRAADRALIDALQSRVLDILSDTGAVVSVLAVNETEWESDRSRVSPFYANVAADGIELNANGPFPAPPHWRPSGALTEEATDRARDELVQTWLSAAREALADAEHAARGERWNNRVSRLYYACFYAVTALLLRHGYQFSKHGSVHGLFNLHFGRTGILPADLVALYNRLFEGRLAADYRGAFQFEEAQVRPWLSETRRFAAFIEQLLQVAPED